MPNLRYQQPEATVPFLVMFLGERLCPQEQKKGSCVVAARLKKLDVPH
ncbi:hypothetical protein ADICEAN_00028 [Cesiribacter andamanensis AMV16]|uniref:Uncharacterized protein n=1 Tax=Cesiribacter andamanensis AMV16 TaxID=1279009 RepID=M7NC14_9BACT|nr:hypothetical protein ADICEAN_00028 [Cesiribacter andamanensis AMV16]